MDKDAVGDARTLAQLVVTESAPLLGQGLAALKALGRRGHALDAPLVVIVGVENVNSLLIDAELLFEVEQVLLPRAGLVKDQDLARGVDVLALVQGLDDEVAGGQPGQAQVADRVGEVGSGHGDGLHELAIDVDVLLVPPRVEASDALGKGGADAILGLDVGGVLRDAVVAAVEGLNKVLVDLEVEQLDLRVGLLEVQGRSNDLLAKVPKKLPSIQQEE